MIPRKDIALLILFVVGIATLWFSSNSFASDEKYRPVNTFVSVATDDLMESVTALDAAARAFHKNPESAQNVKKAIAETRLKYKKIEFYLAFYYPEFTTGFLNGAPLLQTESEANVTSVKDPEGLQVLDEMAGADDAELSEKRSELVVLSQKLVVTEIQRTQVFEVKESGWKRVQLVVFQIDNGSQRIELDVTPYIKKASVYILKLEVDGKSESFKVLTK